MRRPISLALAALLALAPACASHEKNADKAAAAGDWKTAEREYGAALAKDPKKPELQQKYQQARTSALAEATRRAQACWAARDVECAFAESDYVVNLDPGNAAMAVMRADASREAGLLRVRRAEEAANGGDLRGALLLLASAREASQDPAVSGAARAASPRIVGDAVAAADRLRSQAQYPAAIDLLTLATRVDPSVRGRLTATQAEYERWKDAEAERLAQAGDQLLQQGRYAEAEQSYHAATQLRPQSRAQRLAPYAGAMARGVKAAQARDFAGAERAFAEADALRVDRGEAAAQLERVRVRPYAISLRSALVRPVRPDGWPWAGPRSRELDRLTNLAGGPNVPPAVAMDLARRLPRDNQPVLVVTAGLPDGRGVQSSPRRGAYALLDGSFTLDTNAYDDRQISFRVVHDDGAGPPLDAGTASVRLGDLVANAVSSLGGGSIVELRVETVPGDQPDGAVDRLTPIPDRDNLAQDWSLPVEGARGWRVVNAECDAPPGTPAGALSIEVEQAGRVVYRSPPERGPNGRWTPRAVYLFTRPDEQLVLRTYGGNPSRMLFSAPFTGRDLETVGARVNGMQGGSAVLRVEPRRTGPGGGPGR